MAIVHDVAGFILQLGKAIDDEGGEDLITNLKLQKLVYYCQGFNLALYDKPLFSEEIMAWEHGPVCPSLYQELKAYGAKPIPFDSPTFAGQLPEGETFTNKLSKDEQDLINEVYGVYGQYSAWRLREMTHQEPPWKETPRNSIISLDKMKEYFKTQIEQ
jgi:uncharacterized phage-associated protein